MTPKYVEKARRLEETLCAHYIERGFDSDNAPLAFECVDCVASALQAADEEATERACQAVSDAGSYEPKRIYIAAIRARQQRG